MCYTCTKEIHRDLIFQNKSQKAVIVSWGDYYPDTAIMCPLGYAEISVNKEYSISTRNGWEDKFKYIDYFQIFVIDSATNKMYPCDSIKKNNKILKRYQLTLDDVRNLNWTITYP